ncbi:MAG: hypothetical protein HYV09_07535 [Deltaproteobacteria bacterium]|nr:hypothetical protein [Deltaproteobacteria bacterium]
MPEQAYPPQLVCVSVLQTPEPLQVRALSTVPLAHDWATHTVPVFA